jgi:hypothetical protein
VVSDARFAALPFIEEASLHYTPRREAARA